MNLQDVKLGQTFHNPCGTWTVTFVDPAGVLAVNQHGQRRYFYDNDLRNLKCPLSLSEAFDLHAQSSYPRPAAHYKVLRTQEGKKFQVGDTILIADGCITNLDRRWTFDCVSDLQVGSANNHWPKNRAVCFLDILVEPLL